MRFLHFYLLGMPFRKHLAFESVNSTISQDVVLTWLLLHNLLIREFVCATVETMHMQMIRKIWRNQRIVQQTHLAKEKAAAEAVAAARQFWGLKCDHRKLGELSYVSRVCKDLATRPVHVTVFLRSTNAFVKWMSKTLKQINDVLNTHLLNRRLFELVWIILYEICWF